MPATSQALVLLVLFVVPGFSIRAGYLRSRARATPQTDLLALAEAVVASLALLALTWAWWLHRLLDWAAEGRLLRDHPGSAFAYPLVLILAPYPLGLVVGWLASWMLGGLESVRRERVVEGSPKDDLWARAFRLLDRSGILAAPTIWDDTWNRMRDERRVWVRITTTSGEKIVGIFADHSGAGASSSPPQLYLEEVYRPDEEGDYSVPVDLGKGVYVAADQIAIVEFQRVEGESDPGPAREDHGAGASAEEPEALVLEQ